MYPPTFYHSAHKSVPQLYQLHHPCLVRRLALTKGSVHDKPPYSHVIFDWSSSGQRAQYVCQGVSVSLFVAKWPAKRARDRGPDTRRASRGRRWRAPPLHSGAFTGRCTLLAVPVPSDPSVQFLVRSSVLGLYILLGAG